MAENLAQYIKTHSIGVQQVLLQGKMGCMVLAVLALLLSSCSSKKSVYMFTSFHEPANEGLRLLYSYDGYHWKDFDHIFLKPEVGEAKIMRDPSIAQGPDGIFHLVWTTGWKADQGFGYASSKDLIHWSPEQHINIMASESTTVNVWAPEIFFDDEAKQFIIVWASTIPFRFPKGQEDENNNHRLYYTTTTDFKSFSKAKLFLDPAFSVIDAQIVKRGNGDYVLVMKDNTRPNRNILVGFAKSALGPYTNLSQRFTEMYSEGPNAAKVGNDWLIYYDSYRLKRYGAMRTHDFKTFENVSDSVSVPEGHKHGTIFKVSTKTLNNLKKQIGQ